jgi:hypothetical protein
MEQEVKYVNEKVVADVTGIPVQTLRNDRHIGKGIPYRKRGRMVRYLLSEVYRYMEDGKVETEEK